ncbi:hypothetical protein [Marinoscillum sp.]|uniref:hypothetical protein n=1 Tax=Marinoscillum sp. TaxID=2024838 RepID=UPI003BAA0D50
MRPTAEELDILNDQNFLKLKNSLSEKIIQYLAKIERSLAEEIKEMPFKFPEGTFLKAGKISKGEQYQGLPYFILDYPRLFTQKEVFAFRAMLWWGHHFSCTLHLQGDYLQQNKSRIIDNIFTQNALYFCVNDQPWDYHYQQNNYQQISALTKETVNQHIKEKGFLKISDYLPVTGWSEYESFALKSFARFLNYLQ